jgi:hypothetical protein
LKLCTSGISPDSKTGDFSDVKVVSPLGEIPWPELSRLNDGEMKTLMIDVANHTYATMVALLGSDDVVVGEILAKLREHDPAPAWDQPRLPRNWIEGSLLITRHNRSGGSASGFFVKTIMSLPSSQVAARS